jgi:hypothetical protein
MASLLRRLRRGHEILVSFAGRLPEEIAAVLRERRAEGARVALYAQRPYDAEALVSLLTEGFAVHPQEAECGGAPPGPLPVTRPGMVIIDRRHRCALETGEALPLEVAGSGPSSAHYLLSCRRRELVVITGRAHHCDDQAGILVLEELEHLTFAPRCRLPVTRGQWVRVLGVRVVSPFEPPYLPHTVEALDVRPLVRAVEGGAPGHALLAEELPGRVLGPWEAMLRDRGFVDLWDAAAYLQQHRIHPAEALRSVAPEASPVAVWALTAAAALALQQEMADYVAVKGEIQRALAVLAELAGAEAGPPGSLHQRVGLAPRALAAAIDAVALEVVAAALDEPEPRSGYSARTGA